MIKKITVILILIFLTSSCGFTPIYSNKNNNNFSIEQINFVGDKTLNNFLKTNLIKLKNQESNKKYFIETITEYKKNVLTKDITGKITNYKLTTKVIFSIKSYNKKFIFSEKKIMETMDDKFEESKYEKIVKQNFAHSISNKLISALMTFQ
jgi:hypothetical protein